MNLPETFAGGTFGLPLKVAKLVRLAEGTDSQSERIAVITKLWDMGYFLDRVNIIWEKSSVPDLSKDEMYRQLSTTKHNTSKE